MSLFEATEEILLIVHHQILANPAPERNFGILIFLGSCSAIIPSWYVENINEISIIANKNRDDIIFSRVKAIIYYSWIFYS